MTICNVSWCWTLFGKVFSNWVQNCRDPTNRRSCKKQSLPHTILDNLSLDIEEQFEVGGWVSHHSQTFLQVRLAGVYRGIWRGPGHGGLGQAGGGGGLIALGGGEVVGGGSGGGDGWARRGGTSGGRGGAKRTLVGSWVLVLRDGLGGGGGGVLSLRMLLVGLFVNGRRLRLEFWLTHVEILAVVLTQGSGLLELATLWRVSVVWSSSPGPLVLFGRKIILAFKAVRR